MNPDTCELMKTDLHIPAQYRHNNGDRVPVTVLGYDGNGRAWVRWADGFVNMIDEDRLEDNGSE